MVFKADQFFCEELNKVSVDIMRTFHAQNLCMAQFLFVGYNPKFSNPIRIEDSLINNIC